MITIKDINGNPPKFQQWELNRVLVLTGTRIQPVLRFENPELTQALVVVATEGTNGWECKVPNFLLLFPFPFVVSVYLQEDEDSEGVIARTTSFRVEPRLKPQDFEYSDNIGYINWIQKSEEVEALIEYIEGLLESGALKGEKGDKGDIGTTFWFGTRDEYNALPSIDPAVCYCIEEGT